MEGSGGSAAIKMDARTATCQLGNVFKIGAKKWAFCSHCSAIQGGILVDQAVECPRDLQLYSHNVVVGQRCCHC